jgi:hypothetical protein
MPGTNQKNEGGRPLADVFAGLKRIVAEAALSPHNAPATMVEIADRLAIDTATLWRHRKRSAEVSELADQILAFARAVNETPDQVSSSGGTAEPRGESGPEVRSATAEWEGVPDYELARRAARHIKVAQAAMQRFSGRSRGFKHASDLPRATFHLQHSIQQANTALGELRKLTEEWLRRDRSGELADECLQLRLLAPGESD